ncbi:hypothetical protein GWI33_019579 [Rhynchophorus ferrugineus]|uniref:Uncharacterized protein n=1 Tax=Rhynchophorus ferrugineus TaxID=354439 RepID=A0A834HSG6_RHYFE|nr:hypothetical protein GWI33_019579 [Rhynchophorus ferrugineus]
MARYSTALSYVILTVMGIYSLLSLANYKLYFARLSFGIITLTSLIGVWRWGHPIYGYKINKIYAAVKKVEDMLVLACIVTSIWMKYQFPLLLALIHVLVAFLPLVIPHIYSIKKNKIKIYKDICLFYVCCLIILINCIWHSSTVFYSSPPEDPPDPPPVIIDWMLFVMFSSRDANDTTEKNAISTLNMSCGIMEHWPSERLKK